MISYSPSYLGVLQLYHQVQGYGVQAEGHQYALLLTGEGSLVVFCDLMDVGACPFGNLLAARKLYLCKYQSRFATSFVIELFKFVYHKVELIKFD